MSSQKKLAWDLEESPKGLGCSHLENKAPVKIGPRHQEPAYAALLCRQLRLGALCTPPLTSNHGPGLAPLPRPSQDSIPPQAELSAWRS